MARPQFNEKFRRPSIAFTELLKTSAGGGLREKGEYSAFMFRALVIAADTIGGRLETPDGTPWAQGAKAWAPGGATLHQVVVADDGTQVAQYDIVPTRGPVNPPNSIRARVIGNNMDQFTSDDDLRCYWPLFPGIANVSAGELAYVVFEDEAYEHGLWLARVPTNDANQTANQILMSDTVQSIIANPKLAYNDATQPFVTGSAGASASPIRDPHRLTNIFLK
jgi:hypothetical protein